MIYHQIDDFPQKNDINYRFSNNGSSNYRSSNNGFKLRLFSGRALYLASSLLLKILLLAFVFILLMTGFSLFFQWLLGINYTSIHLDNNIHQDNWIINEFEIFQRNFSRFYPTFEEHNKRFAAFSKNMHLLKLRLEHEKKVGIEGQTIWGVTEFFDWTEDEMAKLLIPHKYNEKIKMTPIEKINLQKKEGYSRPKHWDWREKGVVTHVKNQLNCGSCWAFSVVALVESLHAIHNGTLIRLSEQQLIDCDSAENGCEGGYRPYALRYVRDKGLLPESAYPYRGNDGKCQLPSGPIDPTQRVFIDQWRSLSSNEEQIADWVAIKGPVTFGMNATKSMYHYRGGVFSPSQEECSHESLGSHSMEVVGFGVSDQEIPYWILKNSWGSGYGINGGYLHMRRGDNSCGLTREVYSALITR